LRNLEYYFEGKRTSQKEQTQVQMTSTSDTQQFTTSWVYTQKRSKILLILRVTPVAGPILHEGNFRPNLQARFCQLYPADFSVAIYLFVCS